MKKKIPLGILAGVLAVGSAAIFFALSIRQVRCVVNERELSPDIGVCAQLQKLRGTRLLFRNFRHDPLLASLLFDPESHTGYDLANSEKSLSGQVVLYLTDQPPVYRTVLEGETVLVSAGGAVRADTPDLSVPLVVDSAGILRSQPNGIRSFLGTFITQLGDTKARVTEITLESAEKIVVRLTGFPLVLLDSTQDPKRAADRLRLLLDHLEPNSIDLSIRELDLRFELPVLRTFQSSNSAAIDSQE